ncbi:branched-chain amino acid ABC transporter ATP-binding protein/permease [Candidatus Poriferisocius sp.]|uniref:branched-chain amino acid ABC transporter ATP-binding protein/permease n=1 Tax=Candidatus Poriferisocius sp. TaxID=3101276 RepID=UPI003B0211D0
MTPLRQRLGGAGGRMAVRVAAAGALAWLIVLPLAGGTSDSTLFTFTLMFTGVAVAINWNLTGGFTGYVDFGHAVWFGIGAYVTAILMSLQSNGLGIGWPPIPAILLGMVVSGALAALIGRFTMHLKGPYFSIAMLGTFVAMREIVRTWGGLTGGGVGLTLPPYLNRQLFYYLELVLVVGLIGLTWWLRRTRFGAALVAIREDELGAQMRGIATTRLKVAVFSFAGASTGLFGGLWAYQNTFVDPDIAFVETRTIDAIMGTLLGGLGTVIGPIVGSVGLYWLREVLWTNLLDYHLVAQGVLLILIVLFLPKGIVGIFDSRAVSLRKLWRWGAAGSASQIEEDVESEGGHDRQLRPAEPAQARAVPSHERTRIVEANSIVKRFGGLTAVDRVDIEVFSGEMVGLIGPNGSGKTTLFDCLSRVHSLNNGSIRLGTTDITRLSPYQVARMGMARTFQVIRVYRNLTVRENMELSVQWGEIGVRGLFQRTDTATRAKAEQLMEFLMLAPMGDEPAGTLSGGQRRLLEIGMALMSNPTLVLLDEATSGINPTLVEDIKDRLVSINAEQEVSFLMVEHNVQFVADLCERVVVLDSGRKLAEGTPRQVMEEPAVIEAYFGAHGHKDPPEDGGSAGEAESP